MARVSSVPLGYLVHPSGDGEKADPKISSKSILDAVHDTQAFVVANDTTVVVVFRGTLELTDWVTNLKIISKAAPAEWGIGQHCDLHEVNYSTMSDRYYVWGGNGPSAYNQEHGDELIPPNCCFLH